MSVKIDYSKDKNLDEFAIATLRDRYMVPGEDSPQEAFARAAMAFADDEDHAQRLYDYVSNPVSYTHLRAHETPEHLVCRVVV